MQFVLKTAKQEVISLCLVESLLGARLQIGSICKVFRDMNG